MKHDPEDEKFYNLIRKSKLIAPPPNEREASIIWAKICILGLSKRPWWSTRQLGAYLLIFIFIILFFRTKIISPSSDLLVINKIEQSLELDSEGDELSEVADLLALAE